jgi:hypothetical protein
VAIIRKGTTVFENGLIRKVTFGGSGLIRKVTFGGSGLIRGGTTVIQHSKVLLKMSYIGKSFYIITTL